MFFTALLALFGVIHLICGAKFINDELVQRGHGMERMQRFASVFVGFSCTITIIFAITSYIITKRPQCHVLCLPIYGFLLPCLAMPVLFAEGSALYELSRLDTEEVLQICNVDKKEELIEQSGPVVGTFVDLIHRFDEISDGVLDKNMCTKTCPCYSPMDDKETDPRRIYTDLPETKLNRYHNRTRYETTEYEELTPMIFDDNKARPAFDNFEQCYDYWLDKKEQDDSIDLLEKFQISDTIVSNGLGRPFFGKKHDGVRVAHDMSDFEFLKLWNEIEIYSLLEERMSCSGMCHSSLFYFSRDISDGPPKSTCLIKLKNQIEYLLEAYAASSILCGLNMVILFLLHFCLYCRPKTQEFEYSQAQQDQSNQQQQRAGQYQVKQYQSNVQINAQDLEMTNSPQKNNVGESGDKQIDLNHPDTTRQEKSHQTIDF